MTDYYGPYSVQFKDLQNSITNMELRDVYLRQTDTGKLDVLYNPTIPEYSAASATNTELEVTALNTSGATPLYRITISTRISESPISYSPTDTENSVILIQRLLTGGNSQVIFQQEPDTDSNTIYTTPPQATRNHPIYQTPETVQRPRPRRLFY